MTTKDVRSMTAAPLAREGVKKWRVCFGEVEEVTVISETASFYSIQERHGWDGKPIINRVKKGGWSGTMFDSRQEALDFIVAGARKELADAEEHIEYCKERLAAALSVAARKETT